MANIFVKIPVFFREVKIELTKVSWPIRKDLMGATWIVIVSTAIMTVFISIVDFILTKVVNLTF